MQELFLSFLLASLVAESLGLLGWHTLRLWSTVGAVTFASHHSVPYSRQSSRANDDPLQQ